uniref:vacuolar protein sorting-associated protein 33A n=1 Tax=Ciona intestinalis TaxID=7719 RepID=UPI000180C20D|nr:vacuolar protein sorting-associated protein 33A [Ciona intestinalis]|eukprot:XP_002120775.1 vacuolar protein sorting-associated protein 33A [Ciona intestinalis]
MSVGNNSAPHLSGSCVNFGLIRDEARRELVHLLDKCHGSKALVWDQELTEQFGLVAEYSLLKEREVDRMFPLRTPRLPKSSVQHIIFVTRPVISLMDVIASNIRKEEEGDGFGRKEFHIFFVPWKSFLCVQKLEDLGVYGALTNIEDYHLDLIALDSDVLSMENHLNFYDNNISEDGTSLYLAAKAITRIQKQYGQIPMIYGKGKSCKAICSLLQKMWSEQGDVVGDEHPQIDRLLIIDRTADLITPLVTQLTYEGLIDEAYGISNTSASFPPEKFQTTSKSEDLMTEKKKIVLTSKDDLFTILRNCNFNAVGPTLKKQAKSISEKYEERHTAKTVGEMKQFVSHLPQMQQAKASLAVHTNIAELIKEFTDEDDFMESLSTQQEFLNGIGTDKVNPYIEDCLFRKQPIVQVLRLICLQCQTNNGLKPKVLEYYKREIVQTYGYKHLITLNKLEKCGLMCGTGTSWNYNTVRKSLRLVVDDINEKEPQDIAYVHSGYAPLSIRLAEILSHPGWRSIDEVLRIIPGPTVSGLQQFKPKKKWQGSINSEGSSPNTVTLVFFVGGVTYAEVSALRFLSAKNDGHEYLTATTNFVNGNTLIQSMVEPD